MGVDGALTMVATEEEEHMTVKIVVAYKWAPNPQDASVAADGTIDWSRAKAAISDYDPQAFELGRALADATGAELIGVTVGGAAAATPMARKAALSRGIDRLVIVPDAGEAESTPTALRLAAAIRQIGDVDLVLCGDSSVDVGAQMVPSILAGALGWSALTDVTAVSEDAGALLAERSYAGGSQTVRITGPAVLSLTSDATTPRVPGMKDILAAGKKPSEVLEDLEIPTVTPVAVVSSGRPTLKSRKGEVIDGTDPAAAAAALVGKLRADRLA